MNTVLKLRGYTIINDSLDDPFGGKSILCDKALVIFSKNNKININFIKKCIQFVDMIPQKHEQVVKNVILVYNGTITSTVYKILEICNRQKYELFTEHELSIDLPNHELVPKHEKVMDIYAEFTTLQIADFKNYPKILNTDPVSKYYNFKSGDIIRITRKSGIVVYRQCI